MPLAESPGEAAVLPGVVQMIPGIGAAGVMSHPLPVSMDMGRFGMTGFVCKIAVCLGIWCGMDRFRTRLRA